MNNNQLQVISDLQNWYQQYCDGDWEHNETIRICTIDNPGWLVLIDLEGTDCENKPFEKIINDVTEDNWYHCLIQDGKFQGAGGPFNLIDILTCFITWAKESKKSNSYNITPYSKSKAIGFYPYLPDWILKM